MIDIFCNVIDNYGDAGFCLRLSRDISKKNKIVNLYCDNIEVLKKIASPEDFFNKNLKIINWPSPTDSFNPSSTVVEAFSCRLPEHLIKQIKDKKSLVIELDYLTAENFAEECHKLSSFSDGISSYFFFPGFSKKTGGLIIEKDFLDKINKTSKQGMDHKNIKISLFSYLNSKIKEFIQVLNNSKHSYTIDVFEGYALDSINKYLELNLKAGDEYQEKNIKIIASKMVNQHEYDDLLLQSDINLVRGEDSIVRAMLAGKPFLWQIYIQDEDAHKVKLNSLFDKMKLYCDDEKTIELIRNITLSYNGFGDSLKDFDIDKYLDIWSNLTRNWSNHIISLGSLSDNLLEFINEKLKK